MKVDWKHPANQFVLLSMEVAAVLKVFFVVAVMMKTIIALPAPMLCLCYQ